MDHKQQQSEETAIWQFLKRNYRQPKPRERGITEIRGPYYSMMGSRYLSDVLETAGAWIDSLKFAGGSFTLLPSGVLRGLIDTAHAQDVQVSTGGFMEYVITQGRDAVKQYIAACKVLGFDIIEISCGFITLSTDDWLRLINQVQEAGMIAKPEIGIQFGAGGSSAVAHLEKAGTRDADYAIQQARRFLREGVETVMIESEGLTENVASWRTDVAARIIEELGMEHIMFEAADPPAFEWYIRNYGPEINLFVDHSQVLQLECLRQGIWGSDSTWGRIKGL